MTYDEATADERGDDDRQVKTDERWAFEKWYEQANKNAVIDRYSAEQAWMARAE